MKKQIIDDMEIYSHFKKESWLKRNEVNLAVAGVTFASLAILFATIANAILLPWNF